MQSDCWDCFVSGFLYLPSHLWVIPVAMCWRCAWPPTCRETELCDYTRFTYLFLSWWVSTALGWSGASDHGHSRTHGCWIYQTGRFLYELLEANNMKSSIERLPVTRAANFPSDGASCSLAGVWSTEEYITMIVHLPFASKNILFHFVSYRWVYAGIPKWPPPKAISLNTTLVLVVIVVTLGHNWWCSGTSLWWRVTLGDAQGNKHMWCWNMNLGWVQARLSLRLAWKVKAIILALTPVPSCWP